MEIKQLKIETDQIKLVQEQFVSNVLHKHNLTPEQVNIKESAHNNKIDVYYDDLILGRWFTELNFKPYEGGIEIVVHEWH
ncbi:hypothetical protein [Priestia megaterium]|uniref:hypothetical protein n=1 Tax=Priestia megaterium TaxID=1404 RepID=UPI00112DA727|nr:hypothetical protein [Priestia megaterium]TPF18076.1 hypothetical protein CBE78_02280 [Priestia megaterium]TPF22183.1 hypothetical protein CBE79_04785 [Priestia megaterium]